MNNSYFCHETSIISVESNIGDNTKIWQFCHILGHSIIGKNCVIGQNVMIGPDVKIGSNCKIQNNVSIYKGITIEDNVFCGPSCVFTNIKTPKELEVKFKNLKIKVLKCENSKFDDNPEVTAYMQVKDLKAKNNDKVFVFNLSLIHI